MFLRVEAPGKETKDVPPSRSENPDLVSAGDGLQSRSMLSSGSRPPWGALGKEPGKGPGRLCPFRNDAGRELSRSPTLKPGELRVSFDPRCCSGPARDTLAWLDHWPSSLTSAPGACPLNLLGTALYNPVCTQLARISPAPPAEHVRYPPRA